MIFRIKIENASGVVLERVVSATTRQALSSEIEAQGYELVSARRLLRLDWSSGTCGSVCISQFVYQLLVLMQAGLPLLDALETISATHNQGILGNVTRELSATIKQGRSFSSALEQSPQIFPPMFAAIVSAGQRTGDLVQVLARYLAYHKQLDSVRRRLTAALVYPSLLLVVGSLIVVFLLTYVVPRFSRVYEDMGDRLPLLSRLLMAWGKTFAAHGTSIGVAAVLLITGVAYWLSRPETRHALVRKLYALPGIGNRIRDHELGGLYRTLAMLQRGGIPLVTALDMARGVVPRGLAQKLDQAILALRQGRGVSGVFEQAGLAGEVAHRLLRVGERSGELGAMMDNIAAYFEGETEQWLDRVSRLFEPILMLVIGAMIGGIVLLMYMPIFELASSIR